MHMMVSEPEKVTCVDIVCVCVRVCVCGHGVMSQQKSGEAFLLFRSFCYEEILQVKYTCKFN